MQLWRNNQESLLQRRNRTRPQSKPADSGKRIELNLLGKTDSAAGAQVNLISRLRTFWYSIPFFS